MNPSSSSSSDPTDAAIRETAASWAVRQDRSLSLEEGAELKRWLAADARHAEAFDQAMASWDFFRGLGRQVGRTPTASAVPAFTQVRRFWGTLAAAAALVFAFVWFEHRPLGRIARVEGDVSAMVAVESTTRWLPDGSMVRLKSGAEIVDHFTTDERRIRLIRGEAFFAVAKDPARPFLIEVQGVTVRAVGTAFTVRLHTQIVDVLVTEGSVQVLTPQTFPSIPHPHAADSAAPVIGAGYRATVARGSDQRLSPVVITAVPAEEIARVRAWGDPMLELGGATLADLVIKFEKYSGRRIEIKDPALKAVGIGGRFPLTDLDGFLRALDEIYNVETQVLPDGALELRAR